MSRYRFFKHGNEWRCIEKGSDKAENITTSILECVLGVVGGPEVIVVSKQPNGDTYHINIKNGFITAVDKVWETNHLVGGGHGEGYYQVTALERKSQTEFYIENGV
jgi:hypothetical protein